MRLNRSEPVTKNSLRFACPLFCRRVRSATIRSITVPSFDFVGTTSKLDASVFIEALCSLQHCAASLHFPDQCMDQLCTFGANVPDRISQEHVPDWRFKHHAGNTFNADQLVSGDSISAHSSSRSVEDLAC